MSNSDPNSGDGTEKPGPFSSISAQTTKTKRPRKEKRGATVIRNLVLVILILGVLAFFGVHLVYNFKALAYDLDEIKKVPQRTLVYDRYGDLLGHVSGHGENRLVVDATEVSDHFKKALLAREDSRFYDHRGVDYRGIVRAALSNVKAGGMDQGASTITMQLARNAFGNRDMSISRKLLEIALAKRIERKYSKDEILGYYMNRIYFGSGLYGIERASEGFFMKPSSELTLGEGAMLAGIIRGPSLLNPFRNLDDAKATRDEVLNRLVVEEVITLTESDTAKAQEITLRPPDQRLATGSYVLQTVYDLLTTFIKDEDLIRQGGLKIYTTIDPKLQAAAEKELDRHLTAIESRSGFAHPKKSAHKKGTSTDYLQGAVVSLDNATGGILATVGGRDFGDSSFDRTRSAFRQVGSTFKPFVYSVAFDESGLLPGAYVSDDPLAIDTGGGPVWRPKNSDGQFLGLQPAAIGLVRSRNTMSVRVGQLAGLENVRSVARALYFGDVPESPVIYLGGFETSPFTITSAYSTFATGGINRTPFLISKIDNSEGDNLFTVPLTGETIFPDAVTWVTSDILAKTMDEGTGASARRLGYNAPAYGKTGTTNDYVDAWFLGYTDKITTGVWVGLDQPKKIMNRGYGSTLALPIWTEVMKTAETSGYAAAKLPVPANTAPTDICRECGLLASPRTRNGYRMDLPAALRPRGTCRGHGGGLFTNRNGQPQAFPLGEGGLGEGGFQPRPPQEESGVGRALKGIGRLIFGGDGR